MKHIAPGMWEDSQGNPHFSVPELLEHFHWEDTEENRAQVCKILMGLLKEQWPEAKINIEP